MISQLRARHSLSEVSPSLYDLLDQYTAEIANGKVRPGSAVWSRSLVLTFCQNFFNQFFVAEYGHQITGFQDDDAKRAASLRRTEGHSREARQVVALYIRFCAEYPDIIGAGYGSAPVTSKAFHTKYLVRLLARAEGWARAQGEGELAERIDRSRTAYTAAIEAAAW